MFNKRLPFVSSKNLMIFFAVSHIFGWLLANAQTVWIVWRLEKVNRAVIKEIQKIKARD